MGGPWQLLLPCLFFSAVLAFNKEYASDVRQNFAEKSNSDLNGQMASFHRSSLVYMAYASYFDRGSVHLPGFRKFFQAASQAALADSQRVIDYINLRGGHQQFPLIDLKAACRQMKVPSDLRGSFPKDYEPKICNFILKTDPSAPKKKSKKAGHWYDYFSNPKDSEPAQSTPEDWQHGLLALSDALLLERSINDQLLSMVRGATQRKDTHLRHTVEDSFLTQQTERIKKLADVIKRLRMYNEQEYPLGEFAMDLEMAN